MYILPELRQYPTYHPTEGDSLCDWAEFYFLAYLAVRHNHLLGPADALSIGVHDEVTQTDVPIRGLQKESLELKTLSDLDTKGQNVTFGSPSILVASPGSYVEQPVILVASPVTKQVAVQRLFRTGILRPSYLDDKAGTTRYTKAMAGEIQTALRSVVGKKSQNYLKLFRFLYAEMLSSSR